MTTFVYRPDHPLANKHGMVPKEIATPPGGVFHFMKDIQPFVAPGMVEITSRSKLRDYERRTGTRQVGNDWKADDYLKPRSIEPNEKRIENAVGEAVRRVMG